MTFDEKSTILFEVMSESYYMKNEDGLFRMFDVSHDGLEDAIEAANEAGVDVLRDRDGETETVWSFEDAIEAANDIGVDVTREHDGETELVWSFEKSGGSDADEPSDGFHSDAMADGDALASAGFGTDEDYGCFDSGDDDYGCEY